MADVLPYTPIDEISQIHAALREEFRTNVARRYDLAWRKQQLAQLVAMVSENQEAFIAALAADLKKPAFEVLAGEIGSLIARTQRAAQLLDEWVAPERVSPPPHQQAWSPEVLKGPKGVVLIIAPWNYPLVLLLQPLSGAIAAGCPAVIKPSEIAQHHAALIGELVPKYLDPAAYRVVNGGVPEITRLLELKWDHIFYTGNSTVARIIATAAAKHLTPLTLELGGKSPVVVDAENTDLRLAAKRILWGKSTNSGQICVAPDYVLITRSAQDEFIAALKEAYQTFHPHGALESDSYGGIVSKAHYDRLQGLIARTKAQVVLGGNTDGKRVIEPTVFRDVEDNDALLEGEIFGPLLPLVPVDSMQEAIDFISARPHPLALYVFTNKPEVKKAFIQGTQSGSIAFNDVMTQVSVSELPFSGIGESGYGAQYLKYTFDGFTHHRATVDVPASSEDILAVRYPPYSRENAAKRFAAATTYSTSSK
ncbi:aldehyde dehydrogenase [Auriscalpium vulgare]|uniref:Aldehyde dehydrogenase n=1 Tax=Auriscalpium vulgare TaxID=40419 RepID=A0ACB8S9S0_9AGAM|nr:aldehyde dehydrogenase [Auriscalpium vulgare]